MSKLADTSESFKSKTILGLLRAAPDLLPNIKNVETMYKKPEKGMSFRKDVDFAGFLTAGASVETDDLAPQEGKDEAYDDIMTEIGELEEELEEELGKWQKKLGFVLAYLARPWI
jgi:DNA mismatch repair protein MSH6